MRGESLGHALDKKGFALRISRAICILRERIQIADRASFVLCKSGCGCITGFDFGVVKLQGDRLHTKGKTFKLSIDLANKLEDECLIIRERP